MKLFVKSLKGVHFQIEVNPHDTVRDVKKNIESVQGTNVYPATQQMLIYQGRALADGTTLEENKVSENSFIVVMLCKSKIFTEESSVAASAMPTSKSKSSYVGTSVAATTATPTSKCNSSSGDSSVPAAIMRLMPTFKIKKSPGESSVAPATLPKSKSKSSSGDGSGAAAAMPVSKSKISSEKVSVAADPMPASNSKSSSGDGSGAAAAMPVSKSKISSEKVSVAADPMPASNSKSSSGDGSGAAAAMPVSKSKISSEKSSVAADPMPASNSKSSSGKSSVAAADMPISKINSSSGDSSVAAAAMPISKTKRSSKKSSVSAAPMPTSNSESSPRDNSVAAAAIPTSKAPATPEPPFVEAPTTRPISVTTESVPASVSTSAPSPIIASSASESAVGGQAASDLAAGNGLENTIQNILNIGGGIWDRDTVVRALDVAYNNPERAVEYLCSGVPEQAEAGKAANASTVSQQPTQPATVPSSRSNAGPLNIFPQGLHTQGSNAPLSGPLDFLRNSEQFQALRAMVQANPETLQPLLQEFGRKNPNLLRLIQEHQADFQRLLNEPVAGKHGNILEQFAAAMPQSIQVTPAEHKAIERLEAMGFDRSTVLEAYFACNKNEELTANYLLDHMHEFED